MVRVGQAFAVVVEPGVVSTIFAGGQVEKYPAELPAFEMLAVITVEPGCCAVATPFSSIVTIELVCGVKLRCPTAQVMLLAGVFEALAYARATNWPVCPCERQEFPK